MFALKIVIGILSIVIFTKIGFYKSKTLKDEVEFYNSLILFCDKVLIELEYKKSHISKIARENYSSAYLNELLCSYIKNKNIVKYPNFLKGENLSAIKDFFQKLGTGDTLASKLFVKSYKNVFVKRQEDLKDKYKKHCNLYLKLGFMFGLTLMVIVI